VQQQGIRRIDSSLRVSIGAALLFALAGGPASADDSKQAQAAASGPPPVADFSRTLKATGAERQPMNLLLTQAELAAVVRNYGARTGQDFTALTSDEEVLVTAPGVQAPMRDVSQDIGMGIFAPFWAIANPRDAWRIFVPIPPKRQNPNDTRPAPDPR
jgi:hypothetical protein